MDLDQAECLLQILNWTPSTFRKKERRLLEWLAFVQKVSVPTSLEFQQENFYTEKTIMFSLLSQLQDMAIFATQTSEYDYYASREKRSALAYEYIRFGELISNNKELLQSKFSIISDEWNKIISLRNRLSHPKENDRNINWKLLWNTLHCDIPRLGIRILCYVRVMYGFCKAYGVNFEIGADGSISYSVVNKNHYVFVVVRWPKNVGMSSNLLRDFRSETHVRRFMK